VHVTAAKIITGKELSALAKRMTQATDPAEAALVREAIIRGFYGDNPPSCASPPDRAR
jgi:hypothetical protein